MNLFLSVISPYLYPSSLKIFPPNDKSKLSKRQGDVDVESFLKKGYLKEAIINFIALLGWHPNNNDEIFDINFLIKNFSIKKIQKSGAIFDIKKLNWTSNAMRKRNLFENLLGKLKTEGRGG